MGTNEDLIAALQVILKIRYLRHSACALSRVKVRKATNTRESLAREENVCLDSHSLDSLSLLGPVLIIAGLAHVYVQDLCLSFCRVLPVLCKTLGAGQVHSPLSLTSDPKGAWCCRESPELGFRCLSLELTLLLSCREPSGQSPHFSGPLGLQQSTAQFGFVDWLRFPDPWLGTNLWLDQPASHLCQEAQGRTDRSSH